MNQAALIRFDTHGYPEEGYLHVIERNRLPFKIKRVVYALETPQGVTRGRHAHHKTEMILIAVKGEIKIKTVTIEGHQNTFVLNQPNEGLYLPALCWHEMTYSEDAVQLVLCSTKYREADYIRDWEQFQRLQHHHGPA